MNSPPAQTQTYTNNNWMNELYRPYETSRLILQRTNQEDYEPLGRIIMKKKCKLLLSKTNNAFREFR